MIWLKELRVLRMRRRGRRPPAPLRSRPQVERLERRNLLSVILQGTFATSIRPFAVAVGDVNGDGKPDLAVANGNTASVSVLLGNGSGTFAARRDFASGFGPVARCPRRRQRRRQARPG